MDKRKDYSAIIVITVVIAFAFLSAFITKSLFGTNTTGSEIAEISIANNQAERYFYNEEYDKAIEEYKAMQLDEVWPIYSVKVAEINSLKGNIDESNRMIEDSIIKRYYLIDEKGLEDHLDEDNTFCREVIFTLLLNGEYEKALEYGQIFLNENPDNEELEKVMYTVYMANNKTDEADKLKEVLNNEVEVAKTDENENETEPYLINDFYIKPYDYNSVVKLAELYKNKGNDTKAMEYYELASLLGATDADINYEMALVYINKKDYNNAISELKQAIKVNDKVGKYHRALGAVYILTNKDKEAIEETRKAYSLDENDILALNNAACYYISKLGDLQRGYVNIESAYKDINKIDDKEIKDKIIENYTKVKELYDKYERDGEPFKKMQDYHLFF